MHENPFDQGCKASFGRIAKLGTSIKKTVNAGRCLIKKERGLGCKKGGPLLLFMKKSRAVDFSKRGTLT